MCVNSWERPPTNSLSPFMFTGVIFALHSSPFGYGVPTGSADAKARALLPVSSKTPDRPRTMVEQSRTRYELRSILAR